MFCIFSLLGKITIKTQICVIRLEFGSTRATWTTTKNGGGRRHKHRSDRRRAPVLGAYFGQRIFGDVGAFVGIVDLLLSLAIFGQVGGGQFFRFVDLAFVDFQFQLQLIDQFLQLFGALTIFVDLEFEFLNTSVLFTQILIASW